MGIFVFPVLQMKNPRFGCDELFTWLAAAGINLSLIKLFQQIHKKWLLGNLVNTSFFLFTSSIGHFGPLIRSLKPWCVLLLFFHYLWWFLLSLFQTISIRDSQGSSLGSFMYFCFIHILSLSILIHPMNSIYVLRLPTSIFTLNLPWS